MEKESFGFFSDIKSRLLLFVVGLASLYTFVPSIINQSEEFFGIDKIWSYRIFIALYFVLPLLLPTLACLNFAWRFYRKDTEYYEGGTFSDDKIEEEKIEPKYQKYSIIALFIIAISFVLLCVFLFYNSKYYTFIFFGCALFLILACLSMATYYSVKKQISNKKEKTQHHKEWTEVRFQYFLLTILFTTICSIFFYNNFFKIDEKTKKVRKTQLDFNINAPEVIKFDPKKDLSAITSNAEARAIRNYHFIISQNNEQVYADRLSQTSIAEADSEYRKDNLIPDILRSTKEILAEIKRTDSVFSITELNKIEIEKDKLKICLMNFTDIYAKDTITTDITQLSKAYLNKEYTHQINTVTKYLEQELENKIYKSVWVNLLSLVQFKGLLLFNVGLIVLMTLWLIINYYNIEKHITFVKTRTTFYLDNAAGKYVVEEKDSFQTYPEIGLIKNHIYLLLMLILPYFRPYNVETFSFDRPFLQLGNFIVSSDSSKKIIGNTDSYNTEPPNPEKYALKVDLYNYQRKLEDTLYRNKPNNVSKNN